jgi:hypothetical protein
MKRLLIAAVFAVSAAALLAFATTTHAESGVNLTNGDRLTAAQQVAAIAQLKASHAKIIRIPLETWPVGGPVTLSVNLAANAQAAGIQVHLVVTLADTPQIYNSGAPYRPYNNTTYPDVWSAYPLSQLNQAQLYTWFSAALTQLKNAGVHPAAIEVGDEINWAPFNGDFTVPGHGVVYGLADLVSGDNPEAAAVAEGYQRYAQALETVQKALYDTVFYNVPVVSAGLANPGAAGTKIPNGLSAVAINDTLNYLRMYGLDSFVNAYGIHVYPWASTPAQRLKDIQSNELTQCGAYGTPCAITEWGFKLPTGWTCPAPDASREALAQEILGDFAMYGPMVNELLWYDWKDPNYGIWQCNGLTATGALVLSQP